MGRFDDRNGFDDAVRLRLIEQDLDRHDARFDGIAAKVDAFAAENRAESQAQRKIMTGILVSLATGAVMLAINIIVMRAGG